MFDLSVFKRAGAKRARAAADLKGDLLAGFEGKSQFEILALIAAARGEHPPMMGGAPGTFVGGAIGAVSFVTAPGAALLGPLVPTAELPLAIALGYCNAVLFTAAAEAVNFAYGSTTGTAITGATLFRSPTNPTMTAVNEPVFAFDQVPAAALNTYCWFVGVGSAGASIANSWGAFALLGFA